MTRIQLRLKDALEQGKESSIGFRLSTFDIPQDATAEIDKDAGLVTFSFKYVDSEPAGPSQRLSDDIAIEVGKSSGKLLTIRVNVKRYPAGQVSAVFHKAIDEMDRALAKTILASRKPHQRDNYQLVQSVIQENRPSVEHALTLAG
jgi:hypothetical protein